MIAGIIGAAGYAGAELVRLLLVHPNISGLVLASVSKPGETITSLYPNFLGEGGNNSALEKFGEAGRVLVTPDECIARADLVFGALPAGTGETYAKACLGKGISYIDLSADFRFDDDEAVYRAWYEKSWKEAELHRRSVYGLPELNRARIKELRASGPLVIGNPGCYPTAISLACYPVLAGKSGLKKLGSEKAGAGFPGIALGAGPVIADAISGVTGAGREPGRAYHFPECSDSVSAYKVGAHRHTPEIGRNLAAMAGRPVPLIFTPHLGPFNRGILATVYIPLDNSGIAGALPRTKESSEKESDIREYYRSFYRHEPFIRVLPENLYAATNRVKLSNYCDISVHLDHTGSTLIVESAIDNMVKGAAGQAIQNMNLICGFDECSGLGAFPALF